MARYNPTITVKEALASYMNNPAFQEASGKLVINSSTSKRTGALFLYKGKVYAVQVKGYSGRLFTRLVNSGLLEDDQIAELQRKYGRDQENPVIIDYAAQKMMITAEQAGEFIREYSLGAWDDVFSWIGVKVEWKNGLTTENATFSSRPVALERLLDLGEKRAKYLEEIASAYTVTRDDLATLRYERLDEAFNPGGLEGDVMAYATGEYTALDLARSTGVPTFNLISTIYQLWQADRVHVWYGDFKLKRAEIEQMREDTESYGTARPVIRTDTRSVDVAGEEEVSEAPEVELVDDAEGASGFSEAELTALREDPELRRLVEEAEEESFTTVAVSKLAEGEVEAAAPVGNNAHNADDLPLLPEEDVEYDPAAGDEDEEDLQSEEYELAQQREDEEEDGFIPLEDESTEDAGDELPDGTIPGGDFVALEDSASSTPETLDEFFNGGAPAVAAASDASDPLLGSLVAQIVARREELRSTTAEAVDRMAECDESITLDQEQLGSLAEQLATLQAEIDAVQQRIAENEDARSKWETVYDDASAKYSSFQQQLALLQDNA